MEKPTIIVMMTVAFVALTTISEINSASLRRKKNAPPSDPWQLFNISIRANGNKSEGLFPHVFNLATLAHINSNATCGQHFPEPFCKLVEHVKRRPGDKIQCGICFANSSIPGEAHPISSAIDGSHRWWQSPTIANGWIYNWVTITLDLKQVYQVAYVIIKAANSPRPGNWILERSLDGQVYQPWQYFAITDSDCLNVYGIKPSVGVPRYKNDDDVICTSVYSQLDPLENGEIHISLVNGRPGVEGPSKMLIEFTAARFVRLRLQRIRTLNADLMLPFQYDLKYLDPTVTNRYYYSIKDISIGGQCICYGHARKCPVDPLTKELKCQCEGNTCGSSCDRCCPLYNQVPWRQGTYTERAACEECNCHGHADECVYNETVAMEHLSININGDYIGGGVCVGCKHNTMGNNCELCTDGYFLPSGADHNQPGACRPCLCDTIGTNGRCAKDDSNEHLGIHAGDCECLEGYCGDGCEQCSPGFTGYPDCRQCPCNSLGSVNNDLCEFCQCKENVHGDTCDECIPGYYNLQAENSAGCDECFCFSVTDRCISSVWGRQMIKSMDDWKLTDLSGNGQKEISRDSDGSLVVHAEHTYGLNRAVYLSAPHPFLANKVTAYGGSFEYSLVYSVEDSTTEETDPESELANYDVIIEGSGIRLGIGGNYLDRQSKHRFIIAMVEDGWFHTENSTSPPGTNVPRTEFMVVLAEVDRLLIRASYNVYQTEMRLLDVKMDVASESGIGPRMSSVEMCQCPEGYTGTSCESCAPGYRRVDNVLIGGICEPCDCYNRSDICDPYTGECQDCKNNTNGFHCDECALGFHGDAKSAPFSNCQVCACPFESASFAEGCIGINNDTDYTCIHCQEGHSGQYCEFCVDGYFGNPLQPGNYCQPCDCHENVVADEGVPTCDPMTGQCLACTGHTEGFLCDRCQDGYYGTAVAGDCKECGCSVYGSVDGRCDRTTGQCQCLPSYTGRDCSQCQPGFGRADDGCLPCNCSAVGSVSSNLCHPVTGQCRCKPGVGGLFCSECLPSFYGYSYIGCKTCSCDLLGSMNATCDQRTGKCYCKQHVIGPQCNQCKMNSFGFGSETGCKPCGCNNTGSLASQCDDRTGACLCRSGIGGQTCDQCQPGYYGFSKEGCTKCVDCSRPGHVCDPITGRCTCPTLTRGKFCDECQPNSWNYDPVRGCQPCQCSTSGSIDSQCDPITGQCKCRANFIGKQCDTCPVGFYGFPGCSPCKCDLRGTRNVDCLNGRCQCDAVSGQCPCKEHVSGRSCDKCKNSTFSLTSDNPSGCTPCFCFDRSHRCKQAPYVWSEVSIPSQFVMVSINKEGVVNPLSYTGFHVIPEDAYVVNIRPQNSHLPLYWSLPKSTLGDRTLSYNAWLRFKMMTTASTTDAPESNNALVYIIGNDRLHLRYSLPAQTRFTNNQPQEFEIRLHEDNWVDKSDRPVTRQYMMATLQNIQFWMIKVADHSGSVVEARLYDVSIEKAFSSTGQMATAYGIEMCICPDKYTGLSCQDPAEGYYRQRPENLVDVDLSVLIGRAELCRCHGRSQTCDKETGKCLNCEFNTSGNRCDVCKDGFYNAAAALNNKEIMDCRPCACPTLDPTNNYSPTCIETSTGDDYTCDACIAGYTGSKCQRCSSGYYGNPSIVGGGGCRPCSCHEHGSHDQNCHPVTGQCSCVVGITGRACDKCQPRYAIMDGICKSCDEGCTGQLLSSVDEIETLMNDFNSSSAAALLPWSRISKAEYLAKMLKRTLVSLNATYIEDLLNQATSLKVQTERLMHKSEELHIRSETEEEVAAETRSEAEEILSNIQHEHAVIRDFLNELLRPYDRDGFGSLDLAALLQHADNLMKQIQSVKLREARMKADAELGQAQLVLGKARHNSVIFPTNVTVLHPRIEDLIVKIKELRSIANAVVQQTNSIAELNRENKIRLNSIKNSNNRISEIASEAENICQEAYSFNELSAHFLWNETSENYKESVDMLLDLRSTQRQLWAHTEELKKDLPSSEDLVSEAVEHAEMLESQADDLENLIEGSRSLAEDPLKAVTVYENTKQTVDSAYASARKASKAANDAFAKIISSANGTLQSQAKNALNTSREIESRATDLLNVIDKDFVGRVEEVSSRFSEIQDSVREINDSVSDFMNFLNKTPAEGLKNKVHDISYSTALTVARSSAVEKNITAKINSLENDILPRLKQLKDVSHDGYLNLKQQVSQARSQFDELMNRTDTMDKKKTKIRRLGMDISQSILELRKMIEQAREHAASIKVPLYHSGGCVRKYAVPNRSSLSNSIVLHFKTPAADNNQLIFLLNNPNNSNFLALEMVERRIRFIWNLGDGTARVENDLQIESSHGTSNGKETWYRIHAERTGNVGKLHVHSLSDPSAGKEAMASSPPGHIRLDLDQNMDMFIGGAPSDYKGPEELSASSFDGCIGEVQMDGLPIGMFNFRQLVQNVDCGGCFTIPVTDTSPAGVYQFNGYGYVSMNQVRRYWPDSFSISFDFKVAWKDALLFYTANHVGDFISLELKNGQVVFRFGFEGKSEAKLTTNKTYNSNEWTKLNAGRKGLEGILQVDAEEIQGSSNGSKTGLLLANSSLYFAGLPETINTNKQNVTRLGFLGCMKQIMVESRGAYTQDFSEGHFTGMTLGCRLNKAHIVGLPGNGHVELNSPDISAEAGISFSFQTQQADALMLLAKGVKHDSFYSVSLRDGLVTVWLNSGTGLVTLNSEDSYNDGLVHSVTIHKDYRVIELFINNKLISSTRMPPGRTSIDGTSAEGGGLYVGGLPADVNADGMAPSFTPFKGCIMDLLINDQIQLFDSPLSFQNADIGRCMSSELIVNTSGLDGQSKPTTLEPVPSIPSFTVTITLPQAGGRTPALPTTPSKQILTSTSEPISCADEGYYSHVANAASFGDIKYSHAEVEIVGDNLAEVETEEEIIHEFYNMSIQVRTYYNKGLLFYISNNDSTNFLSVQLFNDKVSVVFQNSVEFVQTLTANTVIGDGQWRSLSVVKDEDRITLIVDETEEVTEVVTDRIDVYAPIYVGGLPKSYGPHAKVLKESFKGCIRNFELNSVPIDIANSKAIMGLRQCFSSLEPGVHLDGYGYSVYSERYHIESDLILSFDFRTTQPNGVIFSISHQSGMPALALVMYEGKIVFTVVVDLDVMYSTESETCKFCLCDNQWHTVKAEFLKNTISLQVDNGRMTASESPGTELTLDLNNEFYIGGFPVYATPQGATRTNEFFRGCLRNVRINNTLVDWHANDYLLDVHVSGCPLTDDGYV